MKDLSVELFKNLSPARKRTLVRTLISAAAIVLVSLLVVGYEILSKNLDDRQDLHAIANTISGDVAELLKLGKVKDVGSRLATLAANPDILSGRIYKMDGKLVAEYTKPGNTVIPDGLEPSGERDWNDGQHTGLSHFIRSGGEPVGTLVLVTDRSEQLLRLRYYVIVGVLLTLAAVCLSVFLAALVQSLVSRPIRELEAVAKAVGADKDYSLRARLSGHDETGPLAVAFNEMLDQLQKRDAEVRASEERFRELAETISQVFWVTNVEKNQILYISPGYEAIWGRSCQSLYDKPTDWMEAIHPEDRARVIKAVQTQQSQGQYDVEYRIVRPTGSIRWIRDRAYPIQEPDGKVHRVAGFAEDITELKHAAESAERLAAIVESTDDVIMSVALDGAIQSWNASAERLFGYTAAEVLGHPVTILAPPDRKSETIGFLKRLRDGESIQGFETVRLRKDGRPVDVSLTLSPLRAKGRIVGAAGVIRDITKRKQAELQLTTLGHAVEGTDELICITDLQDRFIFVNRAFEKVHGYRKEEILGRTPEILHSSRNSPSLVAEVFEQTRLGGWRGEILDRRKDGTEFPVFLSTSLVKDPNGQVIGLMGVAQDITERKQAEMALQAQQQEQQAILNSVPAFIWYKDRDNRILRLNQSAADSIGKTVAEIEGHLTETFYPREDAEKYHRDDLEVLNSGQPKLGIVEPLMTASGEKRWIQTDKVPFRNSSGEIIGLIVCAVDVTPRREAEERLRQAEEKYRLLVERVPAVTYVSELGATGRWHFVSPQIQPLLGFSPQEWMDDPSLWYREVHPDDRAQALLHEEQSRGSGRYSAEYRVATRDGRIVWVRDTGVVLRTTDGLPAQLHGILFDITPRKIAEAALRESEQRLQSIMDNSTAVIYLKAADGRFILINRLFESLFHISRAAIIGKTDYDIFTRAAADEFRKNDLRVLQENAPVQFEEIAPHDDGPHTYLSLKFPLLDAAGKPYAVCGISTDITDRKRAEQALQMQARVLENMVEGVFVYDDHERILLTNPAMDAMFGYAPGELVGQSTLVLNVQPPEKCVQIAKEIRTRLETAKSVERHFLNRRKDGSEFISESRVCRLEFAGTWCFVAVVQDVTERQQLEKQILEVSDREQRRIGQDLHDGLCQLLTGTHFAVRALEQKLSNEGVSVAIEAGEIADLLQRANAEARSIARGLHPLEIEAGGLTAALQELAFHATSLFKVACRCQCDRTIVVADNAKAVHVYRIAQEAVNNALKHGAANQVNIALNQSNDSATLTVSDNGAGLPAGSETGSGMGLKIMAYRAKMIGGTLQLQRGKDGGTMVVLEFPK